MGRPPADIDPLQVIQMARKGAKVTEIAEFFGVDGDTIHRRFAAELVKGKQELRHSLRMAQIEVAEEGNPTMLIWLGKQYLGQSDKSLDEYILEALQVAGLTKEDLLELIKNKDKLMRDTSKISFSDFCVKAGYPAPFQEQVEMMEFALLLECTRLLLGSRGYGKTDYLTILGVAYLIYLNPLVFTALIITKSKIRNTAIIGEIENALLKNGIVLDKANASCIRVRGLHGKEYSAEAVTIGTKSLRGRHPKIILMDDPVTEDDVSEATRLRVERMYYEAMKLTMNICIIGQPAHKEDLYGKLRDIVKTKEVPWGTIPKLDADLEAQKIAGVSEESISASYHLKVLSDVTSPFAKVKYVDKLPPGDAVAFIDPSEGGDYTAITVFKGYMAGVAVEGMVFKMAWHDCLDQMLAFMTKHSVRKVRFETNATGTGALKILRETLVGIGVTSHHSTKNKHGRIMSAAPYAHLIHLSNESQKLYRDQVVKYEYKAKFDDAPDSLATGLVWLGLVRGQ